MSRDLVQISKLTGKTRGPSGSYKAPDLIELHLEPYQRVIQVKWQRHTESLRRKTVDWTWTVWIETRLQDLRAPA